MSALGTDTDLVAGVDAGGTNFRVAVYRVLGDGKLVLVAIDHYPSHELKGIEDASKHSLDKRPAVGRAIGRGSGIRSLKPLLAHLHVPVAEFRPCEVVNRPGRFAEVVAIQRFRHGLRGGRQASACLAVRGSLTRLARLLHQEHLRTHTVIDYSAVSPCAARRA